MYFVNDHNSLLQVKLFPKPECSCIEKKHWCHILAVKNYHGEDITKYYKTPHLSNLTRNKNHGITGRKIKGHKTNSDPNPGKQIEKKAAPDKLSEKKPVQGQQRAC